MNNPPHHDPLDVLGEAYEKMFERAAGNFQMAEEKSGALLHRLIDEAGDKAVRQDELSKEDAEKLSTYIKRDLGDAASYLSETGQELKDWLGFETSLLKTGILDLLFKTSDPTTLALLRLRDDAQSESVYHYGEVTGPGTLICNQCGEKLYFYKAGKITSCPKCHATMFHR